jgi:hypothetical protein
MKIKIKSTSNGWILTDNSDSDEIKQYVFEEKEDSDFKRSSVVCFVNLLHAINDLIGPSTSRYDAHRVRISIEPGDKYDISNGGDDE